MSKRFIKLDDVERFVNDELLPGNGLNNAYNFTATVSAASTVVYCPIVFQNCTWTLTPRSASAAGEIGTTYIIEASGIDVANKQITVTHPNNATADRYWTLHIWGKAN